MILPEEENFLLVFRREALLDNSVDFMKVRSGATSTTGLYNSKDKTLKPYSGGFVLTKF